MGTLLDLASLVTIPSGYKVGTVYSVVPTDGAGDLTFTRSNDTATRVGPNGLIEKVRTNVIPYSQAFDNAAWIKDKNGTGVTPVVTANNATAPDGTLTADTIVFDAGAGTTSGDSSVVYQPITATGLCTASFYARVTSGTGQLVYRSVGGSTYTTANLTTTWQRFSAAENGSSGFFEIGIRRGLSNEPINASVTAQMWGAQLEVGDIATDYIPTTTTAVSVGPVANLPRLDYLNSTCPNLLLEPQRTNLLLYSEQFGASGTLADAVVTSNTIVSPDGYTNADSFLDNTANNIHAKIIGISKAASPVTYTYSLFIKAKDAGMKFQVSMDDAVLGGGNSGVFDPSTGTFVTAMDTPSAGYTNSSRSVTNYGNGWYRISFTITTASATTNRFNAFLVNAANATVYIGTGKGVYVYGAQAEVGAYATSYVPTLGAASTRGVEACSKTGISSLIGQTEGVIFWDIQVDIASATESVLNLDAGSFSNTIYLIKGSLGTVGAEMYASSILQSTFTLSSITAGRYKMAIGYANNNTAFFVNGVQVGTTDTSCSVPAMSRLQMGNTVFGASDGNVNQLILFPTRLSNAEIAQLTTI